MSIADLHTIVARAEAEARTTTLAECCQEAGIGVRSVTSRQRDPDTVRRRAVVAWLLRRRGWTQLDIATALERTERQVRRLLP